MNGEKIDEKAAQELIKKDPNIKSKLQSIPDDFFDGKESVP